MDSIVTKGAVLNAATTRAARGFEEGVPSHVNVWPVTAEAGCGIPEGRVDKGRIRGRVESPVPVALTFI